MAKGKRKSYGVYLESELMDSLAFQSLNGKAVRFYLAFLQRRRFAKKKIGKRKVKVCTNKDEIVFTYAEGEKMGFPKSTFKRLQQELIDRGFIDVVETGAGLFRCANIYSLSDRWEKFGKPDFVPAAKQRRSQIGFRKGHPPYGNQNKTVIENGNGHVTESGKGSALAVTEISNGSKR